MKNSITLEININILLLENYVCLQNRNKAADPDITDTTVTATPLNLGACVISRRSGTDGETCYLQTHRTSGTFCRHHIPTSPYAAHIKRHGLPCTAITPYIIHL